MNYTLYAAIRIRTPYDQSIMRIWLLEPRLRIRIRCLCVGGTGADRCCRARPPQSPTAPPPSYRRRPLIYYLVFTV